MTWWIILILIILVIIILILTVVILHILKKTTYISDKDKKFIKFVINIYIDYAEELELASIEEHEKIVKELERIKNKYLNEN